MNNGADPYIKDNFGRSPLKDAENRGLTEVVDILNEKSSGTDENKISSPVVKFDVY